MNNPNQKFVVITVDRSTIAECLNNAIEASASEIPPFTADDGRLTDELCQSIADSLYDSYVDVADEGMADAENYVYLSALDEFVDFS
jgi:hypothetical protein